MKNKKIDCKVVATFFGKKRGHLIGWGDTYKIIDELLKYELSVDAGRPMDTILVNHQLPEGFSGRAKSLKYLKGLGGTKTRNGTLKVIHRLWQNGIGGGFASFNYAFKKFMDIYEYWLFTEDKLFHIRPNYLKDAVAQLESNPKLAYVCTYRIRSLEQNISLGHPPHCNGGTGVTHVKFLKKIYKKYGRLPYSTMPIPNEVQKKIAKGDTEAYDCPDGRYWYRNLELNGEVPFTNIYVKEGYRLEDFRSNEPVVSCRGVKY